MASMIRGVALVGFVATYIMTPPVEGAPTRVPIAPYANCFELASSTYRVDATLLSAIAMAESSMRPRVNNFDHRKRTGTYDIGLMQINSSWLPALKRFNIPEAELYEPCTNISVGAWILRRLIDKHGATWNSVGAYNAACTQLKGATCDAARIKYVRRVHRFMKANGAPAATATAAAPVRVPHDGAPAPQSQLVADPIEAWSTAHDQNLSEAAEKPTHP